MALSNLTKVQTLGIGSNIEVVGVITTGQFKSGTSNLHSTGVELTNLNVSGIATIGGSISIGGTLTYQDVTNIDSVGIITARSNIDCNGDLDVDGHTELDNVNIAGVTTASSGVNISGGNLQMGGTNVLNSGRALYNLEQIKLGDSKELVLGTGNDLKIYHSGTHSFISEEGNGALKFKGDDIRFEDAGGTEALRITSAGRLGLGTNNPSCELHVSAANPRSRFTSTGNTVNYDIFMGTSNATVGTQSNHDLKIMTNDNERLRIASDGKISAGTVQTTHTLGITGGSSSQLLVKGTEADIWMTSTGGSSTTWRILGSTGGSTHRFRIYDNTNGKEPFYIDGSSGTNTQHVHINSGNLVFDASGTGIDFSATASNGTSELLDDYEEGTFTPQFEGLSNTPAYAVRNGKYTKVGRLVHITGIIQAGGTNPTFTTTSDILKITGLPYAGTGVMYYVSLGNVSHQGWNCIQSGNNEQNYSSGDIDFMNCQMEHNTSKMLFIAGKSGNSRARIRNSSVHNQGFIIMFELSYTAA